MLECAEYTEFFLAMMHATPTGEKQTPEEAEEAVEKDSIAMVPAVVPLLSGSGAISTAIIYATERSSLARIGIIIGCCLLISLTTWGAPRVATPVNRWLGKTGST
jgi:multiple antibiotic resistance protein